MKCPQTRAACFLQIGSPSCLRRRLYALPMRKSGFDILRISYEWPEINLSFLIVDNLSTNNYHYM